MKLSKIVPEEGTRIAIADAATNTTIDVIEVKNENKLLREAINRMNARLGDENISDDDSIYSMDDIDVEVNTRHYENDHQLTGKYGFITNVSLR